MISESNDPRSYRQDSSKLIETGFRPKYTVEDAIEEIQRHTKQIVCPMVKTATQLSG